MRGRERRRRAAISGAMRTDGDVKMLQGAWLGLQGTAASRFTASFLVFERIVYSGVQHKSQITHTTSDEAAAGRNEVSVLQDTSDPV